MHVAGVIGSCRCSTSKRSRSSAARMRKNARGLRTMFGSEPFAGTITERPTGITSGGGSPWRATRGWRTRVNWPGGSLPISVRFSTPRRRSAAAWSSACSFTAPQKVHENGTTIPTFMARSLMVVDSSVVELLRTLSVEIGVRRCGTPEAERAAHAVADAFAALGLEPRFQEFPLLGYEAEEPLLEVEGERWEAGPCMYAHPGEVEGAVRRLSDGIFEVGEEGRLRRSPFGVSAIPFMGAGPRDHPADRLHLAAPTRPGSATGCTPGSSSAAASSPACASET